MTHNGYREKVVSQLKDPLLKQFWADVPKGFRQRHEMLGSTINKISPFITDPSMRNIIGQSKSTIDFGKVMNEGKIVMFDEPREVFKHYDKLNELGLDVPYTLKLTEQMKKRGVDIPGTPLTLDELYDGIIALKEGKNA